jgi:hypothetical protein
MFDKWISLIPDKASKSRVILARRKSGKTLVPMVLSLGGFTEEAAKICREKGIGMAVNIKLW